MTDLQMCRFVTVRVNPQIKVDIKFIFSFKTKIFYLDYQ